MRAFLFLVPLAALIAGCATNSGSMGYYPVMYTKPIAYKSRVLNNFNDIYNLEGQQQGPINSIPANDLADKNVYASTATTPRPNHGDTTTKGKYLGDINANPYDTNSVSNPYGAGSKYDADSINNPYGTYGSKYSDKSVANPYANDAPKLYDSEGNYRGKLSSNPHDPESTANPYGRYGSKYSPDSINNPYGAGNPYGEPISVYGSDD